ncbi:MAG: PIN domain-containing protein [Candidatus Verstraetearchaeota archaeon]|nr:PIN domain-containing protein [Candidatus Verstraetearchaeota archaeon]
MAKLRVLLDSSYILPSLGVMVRGLSEGDLLRLEELRSRGVVEFYYSDIVWIELVPKVVREYSKRGRPLDDRLLEESAEALRETTKVVELGSKAVCEAFRLRSMGHVDMIDNLLYGIASENGFYFLSMDTSFKEFLKKNQLRHQLVISHQELFTSLSSQL